MQVAISGTADVFVSDGYCNSRVAQFSANGSHLGDFVGSLSVPHAVALDECKGHLYVASREAKRVAVFELASRNELGAALLARQGLHSSTGRPQAIKPCAALVQEWRAAAELPVPGRLTRAVAAPSGPLPDSLLCRLVGSGAARLRVRPGSWAV